MLLKVLMTRLFTSYVIDVYFFCDAHHCMTFKLLLVLFQLFFLGACSTLPTRDTSTTEQTEHRVRTLVDVHDYISRISALEPKRLNAENIEAITHTPLRQRGGQYDAVHYLVIDKSLTISMILAQQDKDKLNFYVEFITTLPFPKTPDQKIVNDYFERLAKLRPQVIQTHCISKESLFNTLLKNGWARFETNLSASPDEEQGNFDFSSEGGRYLTLTIDGNCLVEFSISKGANYSATFGILKSKN